MIKKLLKKLRGKIKKDSQKSEIPIRVINQGPRKVLDFGGAHLFQKEMTTFLD